MVEQCPSALSEYIPRLLLPQNPFCFISYMNKDFTYTLNYKTKKITELVFASKKEL